TIGTTEAYYNGYTYELDNVGNIKFAAVNSSGGYGSWSSAIYTGYKNGFGVTSLPFASAYNGYLYIFYSFGIISAPIFSSGFLGDFQLVGQTAANNQGSYLSASAYNGYLYLAGGVTSPNAGATHILQASIQSIAHSSIYSYLIDSYASVTPIGMIVAGTPVANSDITISYKPEETSCIGTATTTVPTLGNYFTIAIPSSNGTCTNITTARYYQMSVYMNQSSFTFPDDSSSYSSISGFTLFYHPNAGSRLRGGISGAAGSVQGASGNLQTLDTPR
ncbi:MAG: hypothetical protein WCI60_04245, partial [bacterium]